MTTMTKERFLDLLTAALVKVKENFDLLNQLDSATGDGDHGTAIVASLNAAVAKGTDAIKAGSPFSQMLNDIGWGIMTETSGTTSSLTGSLFVGMGEGVKKEELTPAEFEAMFAAGLANVKTMTSAKPGDKTLMDALVPAIEAMTELEKSDPSASVAQLTRAAADAAKKGAESTKDLTAKFGRAKNLGERSIGHIDAGATGISVIFEAFAEACAE